jgi:hypothetical protein
VTHWHWPLTPSLTVTVSACGDQASAQHYVMIMIIMDKKRSFVTAALFKFVCAGAHRDMQHVYWQVRVTELLPASR